MSRIVKYAQISFQGGEFIGAIDCETKLPCGNGRFLRRDGSVFNGIVDENGIVDGKGILTFLNGKEMYTGDFHNSKRDGKGCYFYRDGCKYNGEWKDDKMCGKGKFFWENGDVFEGEYRNDKRNGAGNIFYKLGDKFEGFYKDDKRTGNGKYYYKNGNVYEGTWKGEKFHGMGTFSWANGDKYSGMWENDKKSGIGEQINSDNSYYYGVFKNGKAKGQLRKLSEVGMWLMKFNCQKYFKNFHDKNIHVIKQLQFVMNEKYLRDNIKIESHQDRKKMLREIENALFDEKQKNLVKSFFKKMISQTNEIKFKCYRNLDVFENKIDNIEKKIKRFHSFGLKSNGNVNQSNVKQNENVFEKIDYRELYRSVLEKNDIMRRKNEEIEREIKNWKEIAKERKNEMKKKEVEIKNLKNQVSQLKESRRKKKKNKNDRGS